jgi:hypothetical protein
MRMILNSVHCDNCWGHSQETEQRNRSCREELWRPWREEVKLLLSPLPTSLRCL